MKRPYCLWVTPGRHSRGSASYALPPRYKTLENAQRALARDYPNGRNIFHDRVRAGHVVTGPLDAPAPEASPSPA